MILRVRWGSTTSAYVGSERACRDRAAELMDAATRMSLHAGHDNADDEYVVGFHFPEPLPDGELLETVKGGYPV